MFMFRLSGKLAPVALLCGALLMGITACGGDDSGLVCETNLQCPTGSVCAEGTCSEQPCVDFNDCAEGEICVNLGGETDVCALPECQTNADCPDGFECSQNQGIGGVCIPEGGTQGNCDGVTCPAGQTCDATTGQCSAGNAPPTVECNECETAADCGEAGVACTPMVNGSFCASNCTQDVQCPIGFKCYAATNDSSQCVPYSYSCSDCVVNGCEAGQICNFHSGACQAETLSCGSCTYDYECSADGSALCYKNGGGNAGVCAPACGANDACEAGSTCVTNPNGRKVCAFSGSTCCYGPNCAQCDCSGATPKCLDGACVQCINDGDCAPGTGPCDLTTNTCAGSSCPPETPYLNNGSCVECLNSTHCASGMCDVQTNTCSQDACSICADPYPACANISGQMTCVQCTAEDTSYCDTIGGTCDPASYTCVGGSAPVGDCTGGCPPSPFTGEPMICDPSGVCVDADGNCDGVTALCPNNNPCESLLGGGVPLPPELLGGTGIPGSCTCNSDSDCTGSMTCVADSTQAALCALMSGSSDTMDLFMALFGAMSGTNTAICMPCGGGGSGIPGLPF